MNEKEYLLLKKELKQSDKRLKIYDKELKAEVLKMIREEIDKVDTKKFHTLRFPFLCGIDAYDIPIKGYRNFVKKYYKVIGSSKSPYWVEAQFNVDIFNAIIKYERGYK